MIFEYKGYVRAGIILVLVTVFIGSYVKLGTPKNDSTTGFVRGEVTRYRLVFLEFTDRVARRHYKGRQSARTVCSVSVGDTY